MSHWWRLLIRWLLYGPVAGVTACLGYGLLANLTDQCPIGYLGTGSSWVTYFLIYVIIGLGLGFVPGTIIVAFEEGYHRRIRPLLYAAALFICVGLSFWVNPTNAFKEKIVFTLAFCLVTTFATSRNIPD